MKAIRYIFFSLILGAVLGGTYLGAVAWSPAFNIDTIEVSGGNLYIRDVIFSTCANHAYISLSAPGAKEIFSIALAAKMANKQVKVLHTSSCQGAYYGLVGIDITN